MCLQRNLALYVVGTISTICGTLLAFDVKRRSLVQQWVLERVPSMTWSRSTSPNFVPGWQAERNDLVAEGSVCQAFTVYKRYYKVLGLLLDYLSIHTRWSCNGIGHDLIQRKCFKNSVTRSRLWIIHTTYNNNLQTKTCNSCCLLIIP